MGHAEVLVDAHYSAFPDEIKAQGFYSYATLPPEDTSFLTTQLWDKYLPAWRHKDPSRPDLNDPAMQADIMEQIRKFDPDAPGVQPHDERDVDKLDFVTISRRFVHKEANGGCFPKRQKRRCVRGRQTEVRSDYPGQNPAGMQASRRDKPDSRLSDGLSIRCFIC